MENPSIPGPAECGQSSTHDSEIDPVTHVIKVEPKTRAQTYTPEQRQTQTYTPEQRQTQTYTPEQRQMVEAEVARLKKQKVVRKVKGSRKIKHILGRGQQQEQTLKVKVMPKKTKTKPNISCVYCAHLNWSSMFRMKELEYLKERVELLKNEKKTLQEQLRERDGELREIRSQSGTIETRTADGKKFSSDLRQTLFHCLEHSVHPHKVETVVRTAVKLLAKKELSNFPSKRAVTAMLREVVRVQETQ